MKFIPIIKRLLLYSLILSVALITGCEQSPKKSSLSVLYVGYNPDRPMPNRLPNSPSPERSKEIYKTRMPAFKNLLTRYFTNVKAMDARDYQASASDDYDVTIFDALPKPIQPEATGQDDSGKKTKYTWSPYLPKDFDKPVIFMASMAPIMGERLGLKLNWQCLCLDADAHHLKKEHPIFHTPLEVDLTMKDKPTPDGVYRYASGQDVPKEIPMWTVQTEGYKDGKGYMIGMVSNGSGFEDSPDAEYISSGVNTKDVGAVALGRQGNFFMWGFSGSPDYMTEEAKKVFINTIHYMDQFDGQPPVVRITNAHIPIRESVTNRIYRATYASYKTSIKSTKEFNRERGKEIERIKKKKKEGKELTRGDKVKLRLGVIPIPSREEYIRQRFPDSLFQKFGMDSLAYKEYYQKYYRENGDYFYYNGSRLVVDEQAKQLGIANNSDKLLDKCISMLEENKNTEMARDLLHRYTTKDFEKPQAWRNWFETNKEKLFFSERGGYKFYVNTHADTASPQNDVAAVDDSAIKKVFDALKTADPNPRDPVAIAADIVKDEKGNPGAVVMKVNVLKNWHIYALVSKDNPYIETDLSLKFPEGITSKGDWQEPDPQGLPGEQGVFVYEGEELQFSHLFEGSSKGNKLTVAMRYQVCDINQCLPPATKKISITL